MAIEWHRVGSYWMDPHNTVQYGGHNVVHLVATAGLSLGFSGFGRLANLTNERYAERSTYDGFRGEEFAPAMPRTLHLGVRYQIEGDG